MPATGSRSFRMLASLFSVACLLALPGYAQSETAQAKGRKLAPSILNVIPPGHEPGDTSQGPVDLPLVSKHSNLAWEPKEIAKSDTLIERSKQIVFRGDVHCLEFAFKPVRMIDVELPTKTGFRQTRVWYLLYRVRYLGSDLRPTLEKDKFANPVYDTSAVSAKWVRFIPDFRFSSSLLSEPLLDRVIHPAKKAIAERERVGATLHDSVSIQRVKIPLSTTADDHPVWGVATWIGINPNTDFFSVQVRGLTNAQQVEQGQGEFVIKRKTLELFFTRPGDTIDELEDRIRFGIPAIEDPARQRYFLEKFGVQERVDYQWIYR